jgi:hypothetical protein
VVAGVPGPEKLTRNLTRNVKPNHSPLHPTQEQTPMADNKQPLSVFVVSEREDKKTGEVHKRWREVGVAWPNADGKGFSVQIDPGIFIGGDNIAIRERKTSDSAGGD